MTENPGLVVPKDRGLYFSLNKKSRNRPSLALAQQLQCQGHHHLCSSLSLSLTFTKRLLQLYSISIQGRPSLICPFYEESMNLPLRLSTSPSPQMSAYGSWTRTVWCGHPHLQRLAIRVSGLSCLWCELAHSNWTGLPCR